MAGYDATRGGYVSDSGAFYPTNNKTWVPKGNNSSMNSSMTSTPVSSGTSKTTTSTFKASSSSLPTSNLNNVTPSASDKVAVAKLSTNPYTAGLSSPYLGTPSGSSTSTNKVTAAQNGNSSSLYCQLDSSLGGWLPGCQDSPITTGAKDTVQAAIDKAAAIRTELSNDYKAAKDEIFGLTSGAANAIKNYVDWMQKEAPETGAAYGDTIGQFLNKFLSGAGQGVGGALAGTGAGLGQGMGYALAGTGQGLGYGLGGAVQGVGQGLENSDLIKWVAIGFFGYLLFKEVSK